MKSSSALWRRGHVVTSCPSATRNSKVVSVGQASLTSQPASFILFAPLWALLDASRVRNGAQHCSMASRQVLRHPVMNRCQAPIKLQASTVKVHLRLSHGLPKRDEQRAVLLRTREWPLRRACRASCASVSCLDCCVQHATCLHVKAPWISPISCHPSCNECQTRSSLEPHAASLPCRQCRNPLPSKEHHLLSHMGMRLKGTPRSCHSKLATGVKEPHGVRCRRGSGVTKDRASRCILHSSP